MKKKAKLISNHHTKIYQIDEDITPFSFGNAIFINKEIHNDDELQEIIRHEFVHVKQKHTVDIIWCELLCILNWYNPFAWLLRWSMKQNLEFIADNKVLQNGFDKKEYQYLLLKVMGNRQFAFTNHFNFSFLKRRIVMMNTIKSAKVQLIKFMFLLPVVAVLLLSFRKEMQKAASSQTRVSEKEISLFTTQDFSAMKDTVPAKKQKSEIEFLEDSVVKNSDTLKLRGDLRIILRGTDSTKAKEPLFVLDGKPLNNSKEFESIQPDNIESVHVIKNDAATAVYGPRGANGVVFLTTKKGIHFKSAETITDSTNGKFFGIVEKHNQSKAIDASAFVFEKKSPVKEVTVIGYATKKNTADSKKSISISGNDKPLIVADGKIIANDELSKMNPNTIESIHVFKDAQATSLYGDKGKNGVVEITTKKHIPLQLKAEPDPKQNMQEIIVTGKAKQKNKTTENDKKARPTFENDTAN